MVKQTTHEKREGKKAGFHKSILVLTLLAVLTMTALLLASCGGEPVVPDERDPVEAYMAVLAHLEDPADYQEADNLKYISLDMRRMGGSSGDDQERFMEQVADTYDVEVLDYNEVQLQRKGYLDENRFLGGILFRITDTQFDKDPVKLKVMEWQLDSSGVLNFNYTLEYKDDEWVITDVEKQTKRELS